MVFFLYGKDPKSGACVGPFGSGIFWGYPAAEGLYNTHVYAVTAHHCLRDTSAIRINTSDGKSRMIEAPPEEWEFDPKKSDVAIFDVTDLLREGDDDYSAVPPSLLATKDFIAEVNIGIGEDGFMLGLLGDQAGKLRNLISFRSGNLTMLAQDTDPIEQPNKRLRPAHLFDIRSRPGYSGSPVFIYRTLAGDLRDAPLRGRGKSNQPLKGNYSPMVGADEVEENTFIMLLGIHVAQYRDTVEVIQVGNAKDAIKKNDKWAIPNSITVVVPVWEVAPLFDHPKLVEQRKKREMEAAAERAKKNTAMPEVVSPPAAPESPASVPEGDERHKERFTALLDGAVGKPKQGD